jgi:hypothetical protein
VILYAAEENTVWIILIVLMLNKKEIPGEVYMSNLGQAIEEEGIAIGEARIILNMYKNGFTAEQIAAVSDKDIREIEAIVETVI